MRGPEMTKPAGGRALYDNDLLTGRVQTEQEAYDVNNHATTQKKQAAHDELFTSFSRASHPGNGSSVSGYDYLHDMARIFSEGQVRPAICLYEYHIEVAARAPKAALKGLRRVCWDDTPAALCWRQGHSGNAPLYALDGLGQLAALLSAAAEVRA